MALLTRRDPIELFDEVSLYESELDDHGVSSLSVKIRVTESCWFLLLRFWLCVDGVLIRSRETRLCCDLRRRRKEQQSSRVVVLRETRAREETWSQLKDRGAPTGAATGAGAHNGRRRGDGRRGRLHRSGARLALIIGEDELGSGSVSVKPLRTDAPQTTLYPVTGFQGTKSVVLSTTEWVGGKNDFLGVAYVVVGVICLVLAMGFTIKDRCSPRKEGDAAYLRQKGERLQLMAMVDDKVIEPLQNKVLALDGEEDAARGGRKNMHASM